MGSTSSIGLFNKNAAGVVVDENTDFIETSKGALFADVAFSYYGYPGLEIELGDWAAPGEGFVGVNLEVNGEIHYGWIRLELDTANERLLVKDHLLVNTAGGAVETGAMEPLSVDPDIFVETKVYQANKRLFVTSNLQHAFNYRLFSMTGALVETRIIPSNFDQSLEHLSAGTYIVVLEANGQKTEKKIVIN